LLTTRPFVLLAQQSGFFDEIVEDVRPKVWDFAGWLKLRDFLTGKNFTRIYDLQTNDRTKFYHSLFFPGPYPEWVGHIKSASHPHLNPDRDALHMFDLRVEQLKIAGIETVPLPNVDFLQSDIRKFNPPENFIL